MAAIKENRNAKGEIISYRIRACVGRDAQNKQVWRTTTLPRPEGLTPKKEENEIKRQADEWELRQKEEYQRTNAPKDKTKITFSAFVSNVWWNDHVMDGSHTPNSIAFYKAMSDDLVDYFNIKKLSSIDAEAVKRYIKYLQTKATTKNGSPYSATTVVRHYQTLRNILNYALRFGYIKDDPCKYLTLKDKPTMENKGIDFLKPEDAKKYILCLENEPLFWRCFENLLITTGLRRGEAVGLQWGDIDSENLTITVCRNVTMDKDSEEGYHIGKTKTGEARVVPISDRLKKMLDALKADREADMGNITILPSGYVFAPEGDPYRPIYPTEPTKWQSRFVKRYNLPKVSPHDLRHTAATLALESGADLKMVQELLGHKDPSTTMRFYAGVTDEAKRRTIEGIESIIAAK